MDRVDHVLYKMKIYIIGAAGSGKSTLADQLSEKTGISRNDLDDIFWDNSLERYGKMRDESERDLMYSSVLQKDSWIVEGAYLNWPKEGFSQADTLIYLDIKTHTLNHRIRKRFLLRRLHIYKNKKKETLKGVRELLRWNKSQTQSMREFFTNNAGDYPNLIRLKRAEDVSKYLGNFMRD